MLVSKWEKQPMMVTARLFCSGVLLLALVGCAMQSGNYGLVVESREIDQQFKKGDAFPADYKWYYTGSPGSPRALMGISSPYRLDSNRWKSVNSSAASVSKMVSMINNNNGQYKFTTFGSRIEGPGGEMIGVWYSPFRRTAVAIQEDGTLTVAIPKESSNPRLMLPNN